MFRTVASIWKLAIMLVGLIAAALCLIWVLTSTVLTRALEQAGRAVVLDDLGEYEALYQRVGVEGVTHLFAAGKHERDQFIRIVDASGHVKLDLRPPKDPRFHWPDLPITVDHLLPGETAWLETNLTEELILTVGCRKLADKAELWFARTNAADVDAIGQVHRSIALGIGLTAALAIGPVFWFSSRVLQPVRKFIGEARQLARADATVHRLESPGAILELEEFAQAFNESLDRVQSLTEELEAANDQLAHELRTPLARIRGNIESILSTPDLDVCRDHAARAIAETDRATQLIQVILSIRAGDSRTLKLQPDRISFAVLVAETSELYVPAAEERGLELSTRLPRQDTWIHADRQRLQQALCNLLDNALAYTPRGGRIQVGLDHNGACAVLWVRDSGPGLAESDHDRIWRRFMRGAAASANTPGIGLGLSLVKAVVNAHNGLAGACNRPEGGAEFWIRLPLAVGKNELAASLGTRQINGSGWAIDSPLCLDPAARS